MTWLGLGILIIGIAFFVLVILLIGPLNNLGDVLSGLQETTEKLPDDVGKIFEQTNGVFKQANDALYDVNEKLHTLSPLFSTVNDIGQASHNLSSTLTRTGYTFKENALEAKQRIQRENLEGIYESITLAYYFLQSRKKK